MEISEMIKEISHQLEQSLEIDDFEGAMHCLQMLREQIDRKFMDSLKHSNATDENAQLIGNRANNNKLKSVIKKN
jgi:hypothetical protein